MNLSIVVPSISSDTIWFASKAAWENYWNRAVIPLEMSSLTLATTTTAGVVKQAAAVSYSSSSVTPAYLVFEDVDGNQTQMADKSSYDALLAKVNALDTAMGNLLSNLQSAGILA